MKKLSFIILLALANNVFAQAPVSYTSAEIYLGLKKLNVLGSVLYVAAHPDDENTRLLTYFSKDKLYRTGYLSLTRGDGGQNLVGDEQGIELGMIRTQELLAARRIDGAEQFFTRAYDFGYSKTPAETFTKWPREKILADVVWVIRKFQPDVIVTRFPTTGEGGHGHHTASGILANEAFTAAADPKMFPEQLKYVQPWQAKRILWNTFNFGGNNTTNNNQFKFDVGGYNPLLGKSYGEISATSRSQHKSQGFGASSSRGEAMEFFALTGGTAPVNDLFDDVNTGWQRVKGGETIQALVNDAIATFDFLKPEQSVPKIVAIHRTLQALPESYWRNRKLEETKILIEAASGLFADAFTNQSFIVHGDSVRISITMNNRLGANVKLKKVVVEDLDTSINQPLSKNRNLNFSKTVFVKESIPISQPYWLENKMEEGYFNVTDPSVLGQAEVVKSFIASFIFDIEGQEQVIQKPVKYKFTDPVKGEQYQPLAVLPAITFAPDEEIKMTKGDNKFEGTLEVTSKRRNVEAFLKGVETSDKAQVKVQFEPKSLKFASPNQTTSVQYKIDATRDNEYNFVLRKDSSNPAFGSYSRKIHQIKYDHIPAITYFSPVTVKNQKLDIRTSGKRIGYIVGAGDKVPESLEQMGYEVVLLTEKEISRNNLQQFDAIITGVRAYNTNEWMNRYYNKLMQYVENGGNLIVQYNTSSQIGPVRAKIGPYNFDISRARITDENAPVTFLKPEHRVLNFPNKITANDFTGWVQERSIYHASRMDPNFEAILGMNDPGEQPDNGGLVIAKHGKGFFTYTGLVFFRELPAGVPGAYRLMANLIALNQKNEM